MLKIELDSVDTTSREIDDSFVLLAFPTNDPAIKIQQENKKHGGIPMKYWGWKKLLDSKNYDELQSVIAVIYGRKAGPEEVKDERKMIRTVRRLQQRGLIKQNIPFQRVIGNPKKPIVIYN